MSEKNTFSKDEASKALNLERQSPEDRERLGKFLDEAYSPKKADPQAGGPIRLTERQLVDQLIITDLGLAGKNVKALDKLDPSVENEKAPGGVKAIVHEIRGHARHTELVEKVVRANKPSLSDSEIMVLDQSRKSREVAADLDRLTVMAEQMRSSGGMPPVINFSHSFGTTDEFFEFQAADPESSNKFFSRFGIEYKDLNDLAKDPKKLRARLEEGLEGAQLSADESKRLNTTLDMADRLNKLADTGAQLTFAASNYDGVELLQLLIKDHENIHVVSGNDQKGEPSKYLNPNGHKYAEESGRAVVFMVPSSFKGSFADAAVGNAQIIKTEPTDPMFGKPVEDFAFTDAEFTKLKKDVTDLREALFFRELKFALQSSSVHSENDLLKRLDSWEDVQARLKQLPSFAERNGDALRDSVEQRLNELAKTFGAKIPSQKFDDIRAGFSEPYENKYMTLAQFEEIFGKVDNDRDSKRDFKDHLYRSFYINPFEISASGKVLKEYATLQTTTGGKIFVGVTEGNSYAAPEVAARLIRP